MKNLFSLIILVLALSACNNNQPKKDEASIYPVPTAVWIVTDKEGNKFDLILNKDGTATSTWSVLDNGKWKVVSTNKVQIAWSNGANEFIIVDERGGAERQTFAPGQPIEGKPETVAPIVKK